MPHTFDVDFQVIRPCASTLKFGTQAIHHYQKPDDRRHQDVGRNPELGVYDA